MPASESTNVAPPPPPAPAPWKWFWLYYSIASLTVLAVLSSLWTLGRSDGAVARSLTRHRQWEARLEALQNLDLAALDLVQQSLRPATPSAPDRPTVLAEFARHCEQTRQLLADLGPELRQRLLDRLEQLEQAMYTLAATPAGTRPPDDALLAVVHGSAALHRSSRAAMLAELDTRLTLGGRSSREGLAHGLAVLATLVALLVAGWRLMHELRRSERVAQAGAAALRESEERFRLLVEGVQDYAICLLDRQGHVVTWNTGAERINGYAADEIVGRHFSCFFVPEARATGEPARELAVAAAEGRYVGEAPRLRKDGHRFWASIVISALRDPDGQLRGFAKITRDTTDRHRAEQLLRSIVDNTLDGIISIDERGVISSFNKAAERIFGYTEPEVLGRNVKMLMPEPYRQEHDGYIDNYHRTGVAKIIGIGRQVSGRRKDGSVFPMDLAVGQFSLDGRRHYTGVVRDVTQTRQLEQQLRQAQKMEAVGQLAGGVAHDFNNILAAIISYTELSTLDRSLATTTRGNLEQVLIACRRARDLVQQILRFSRRHSSERAPIHLREPVGEALKLLRATVPAGIAFDLQLADTSPALAAPGEVHQVVMNLGTNAWHAMGERGTLRVRLDEVAVDAAHARAHPDLKVQRYVRLSVQDSGSGMDEATLERIYEPFFTTKPPGEGSGLGLPVVHGIMTAHEGAIVVRSRPGEGSRFDLYFPAQDRQALPEPAKPTALVRGAGEHILFVDDEPALATAGRRILEQFGYRVTPVTQPARALELFRAQPQSFHLLITDLTMPGMDGTALYRQMREVRPGLRAILTTGYGGAITPAVAQGLGFSALILKPTNLAQIVETVGRALAAPAPDAASGSDAR